MVGVDSLFAKVHSFLSLGSNDDTHGRITLLRHIRWRKWAGFGPLPCAQSVPLCTLLHLNQVAWNLTFSPAFQWVASLLRLFRLQQLSWSDYSNYSISPQSKSLVPKLD